LAIAAESGSATITRKVSDDCKAVATYRSAIVANPAIATITRKVMLPIATNKGKIKVRRSQCYRSTIAEREKQKPDTY